MKLAGNRFSFVKNSAALVAIIIICVSLVISIAPAARAVLPQSVRQLAPADMQDLIFVWASGAASIQQQAAQLCWTNNISPAACADISADVRSAWLALMQVDPASLGRIGVQENLSGRDQ